MRKKSAEI